MFKTSTPLKTNISPENSWLEDYTFLLKMVPSKRTSKIRRGEPAVLLILHPNIQPVKDSVWSGVGAPVSFDAHVLEQRFALADARTKTVQRSAGHIPGEWPCGPPGWLFAVI